jgi:hypothetical protein
MACRRFGLAEDHASGRPEGLADHLEAGGRARVLHHFPVSHGIGIMARRREVRQPDLGIVTLVPRSRSIRSPCRPEGCRCSHASPPYRQRIHLGRILSGDYQRERYSFTISNYGRLAWGKQRVI